MVGLVIVIFIILIISSFRLQITERSQLLAAAESNYKLNTRVPAPRGIITDIDGKELVYNVQGYSLYVNLSEFKNENIDKLSFMLGENRKDIEFKLETQVEYGRVSLRNDISNDEYLDMAIKASEIEGVYVIPEPKRNFADNYLYTHIIGYIGGANAQELNDQITEQSLVGKTGLELEFDDKLRGIDGSRVEDANSPGGSYVSEKAEPGNNLVLNIDADWQSLAYRALSRKTKEVDGLGGAVVIMNANNGELKALASYPSYNIQKFTEGISQDDYQEILNDPGSPLQDRATAVAIPTGSVFKVLSASIGLDMDVITPSSVYKSDGCIILPGGIKFCESLKRSLGDVDVYKAISRSSNIYFCEMAKDLSAQNGLDAFIEHLRDYGIGEYTGIDLPSEVAGTLPDPSLKEAVYGEPWYIGDLCNTVIGQGLLSATPIQMAVATAAIENGGDVIKPQLVNSITNQQGATIVDYEKEVVGDINIEQDNIQTVRSAMSKAVRDDDGTVRKLNFYESYITGKTGTASAEVEINGQLYDQPHAWVMGVFEYKGEKYSYVVNIAHGGWGEGAVDIIAEVLQEL